MRTGICIPPGTQKHLYYFNNKEGITYIIRKNKQLSNIIDLDSYRLKHGPIERCTHWWQRRPQDLRDEAYYMRHVEPVGDIDAILFIRDQYKAYLMQECFIREGQN